MAIMRPRLAISFSGGRTSAVMTRRCINLFSESHDIVVTFANTGCEHPATLDFVRDCDNYFNFKTVWMEAITTPGARIGVRPRIVTYDTASRDGKPFESYIAKYGVPNRNSPQCTSRLKTEIMEYYLRKVVGWKKGTYKTAIGIRSDEMDRVSAKKDEYGFIYPLLDAGIRKQDVLSECASWPFDLRIPGEHWGNCVWCWKKSFRKLMTLAKEDVSVFQFPHRMENTYGHIKAKAADGRRRFFRMNKSAADIVGMSMTEKFALFTDEKQRALFDERLDVGSACGESCEIGADE